MPLLLNKKKKKKKKKIKRCLVNYVFIFVKTSSVDYVKIIELHVVHTDLTCNLSR